VPVEIEIFGQLLPGEPRRRTMEIQGPTRIGEIVRALGLEPDSVGLITLNGVQSEMEDTASPGSRLCIFPYVTGG
jgi:hypothetical protein